ncbi:hypothetical protein L207DRAFT_543769 [Hyaloscypha variabilis F]|uniref:Integral membrane protein n=1 Tax=Hyaloscypha variabilis (strain UAMH 11265 / GT02V1 / F) TaxID=1149755 RepID=A0A2J6RTJ8_HYAVF|nr:hypothetical protein L207DRAFT_543769 [Hyaloscypha variabilis F]
MTQVTKPTDPDGLVLEAWAQGYMVGSIIIMICITLSNIRRGVLLHKLILLELICGTFHGTFIFTHAPVYGWYLSVTAIFLIFSWGLHNVVAWMKTRPFIGRKTSIVYIVTVALAQLYWILEIYADFTYFNNISDIYLKTRVFEALFRDPWWVYTTCCLLYNIRIRYNFGYFELMRISPRFAIMFLAMILSIIFTIIDICAVTDTLSAALPIGINPFWKLAFVFKLLTDSVILDDFKTALDKLSHYNLSRIEEQMGENWASGKNIAIHRERRKSSAPRNFTTVAVGGTQSSASEEPWITVMTETKVESFGMRELGGLVPLKHLPR